MELQAPTLPEKEYMNASHLASMLSHSLPLPQRHI